MRFCGGCGANWDHLPDACRCTPEHAYYELHHQLKPIAPARIVNPDVTTATERALARKLHRLAA